MSTLASEVKLFFEIRKGGGNLLIDWGDGTKSNKYIIQNDLYSQYFWISNSYSGASEHRITIVGDNIEYLKCRGNQLTSLDVSNYPALSELECSDNRLTTLDVSKNMVLSHLNCDGNQLTTFDVSKNIALHELGCGDNPLKTLDVSKNIRLNYLYCYDNQLTNLDVSRNDKLTWLDCSGNQLMSLDVSRNTDLIVLSNSGNQLTTLDVSRNTSLGYLYCEDNQLKSLDVSRNTELYILKCNGNQLTTAALNDLFRTLPDKSGMTGISGGRGWSAHILFSDNPGASDCDFSIATEKNWIEWRPGPKSMESPVELNLNNLKQFININ